MRGRTKLIGDFINESEKMRNGFGVEMKEDPSFFTHMTHNRFGNNDVILMKDVICTINIIFLSEFG